MSTIFKGLKANIQGGIGTQLLRTIACAGEAICNQIKPENILVEVNKYRPETVLSYHNKEEVEGYIETKMIFTTQKPLREGEFAEKSYNYDKDMLSFCKSWLQSHAKDEYLKIPENFYFPSTYDNQNAHIIWVRAKERTANPKAYEQIVLNIKQKELIRVISNDAKFIGNSDILKQHYESNSSIQDFRHLVNARNIYTQLSAFCIAPFLLSKRIQTLYLLDKTLHRKEEFPFLQKDWDFFVKLLSIHCQINPGKEFRILKMSLEKGELSGTS